MWSMVARYALIGVAWSYILPLVALTAEDAIHGISPIDALGDLHHHLLALFPSIGGGMFGAVLGRRTVERMRALEDVRQLGDLLPMCSSCKKIRDDDGSWQEIEDFISDRSGTELTHGLCPGCARELYGHRVNGLW
jgi:hypothetical protein